MQVRLQIVEVEIEADIAIKISIARIAGITFNRAPDLFRRFRVPSETVHTAARAGNRRVDTIMRPRLSVHHAVRLDEEILNAALSQELIDAIDITALREPDAVGPTAEVTSEFPRP